jgi:site-specific DNA recombinase
MAKSTDRRNEIRRSLQVRAAGPLRRVVIYTRVSTSEQADRGYSLREQEARLRAYCAREGLSVVAHFQDDASAKSFDRPGFTRLLALIEEARSDLDAVLVVKWDRFSRDATGALAMIQRLDRAGVAVQAIEQPIDPQVPEQLLMLAIYVAAPEVENRRRSMATRAGMRRAMLEGRYVNVPPKGYVKAYDAQGKYLMAPGEGAAFVSEAFRAVAAHPERPVDHARQALAARGFRCSANQFLLLLRNPIYTGRIIVPADGKEPEQEVEGLHEPLVDAATFAAVQRRLSAGSRTRTAHRRFVPELPLRGTLRCPDTGAVLSGSASKSRHGYAVWYYHGKGAGAYRIQARSANAAFEAHLDEVRLAPPVARLLRAIADERAAAGAADVRRAADRARLALEASERKLLEVDTRFLDGALSEDSYARLLGHYRRLRDEAALALLDAEGQAESHEAPALAYAAAVLEDLPGVWRRATPEARAAVLGSIWPSGICIVQQRVRTLGDDCLIGLLGGIGAEKMIGTAPDREAIPIRLPGKDSNLD